MSPFTSRGSIQPHGVLLAVREPELTIIQPAPPQSLCLDVAQKTCAAHRFAMLWSPRTSDIGRMAPRETDLNELVLHVRQQLAALIEKNNARIDQQPLPTLPVEPSSIALVLQNLIMNVLKYRHRDVPPVSSRAYLSAVQASAWKRDARHWNWTGYLQKSCRATRRPDLSEAVAGHGAKFYLELPVRNGAGTVDGNAKAATEAGK